MAMTAQIFPCSQPIFCESFSCRTERRMGKWFLGSPDGPRQLLMVICDECRRSVAESLNMALIVERDAEGLEVKADTEAELRKPAFTFD